MRERKGVEKKEAHCEFSAKKWNLYFLESLDSISDFTDVCGLAVVNDCWGGDGSLGASLKQTDQENNAPCH